MQQSWRSWAVCSKMSSLSASSVGWLASKGGGGERGKKEGRVNYHTNYISRKW